MKKILREPLLHFLILGAALFAAFSLFGGGSTRLKDDEILVTPGKIEHMAALFARTWQRPPTRDELEGIINDYIREEAAYREGMAIGLDRDDTIVRRRIRQKIEFISDDLASQIEPTDEDLKEYLEAHKDKYRADPKFSFKQIYFDPQKIGNVLDDEINSLKTTLDDIPTTDISELGDPIMLEPEYNDLSTHEISGLFGYKFLEEIIDIEPGVWAGPFFSAYGPHLVFITERTEGRMPELDEVRFEVRRDWENVRRKEMTDKFYDGLLAKYKVTIEWPEPETAQGSNE